MSNTSKIPTNQDSVIIFLLWIFTSFGIFYTGSVNADIWGKWQGFEIVLPLIISVLISSIIILPIYLIRLYFKK